MELVLLTSILPVWYLYGSAFLLGSIVGSFLNVFLLRFHTGKSINGRSHCMSCQHPLRWYDLFPLLSFLWLRGRCRQCGAQFSGRYFLVEVVAGGLAVVAIATTANPLLWPLFFMLMMLLLVIGVYDIDHMIIPHEFVYTLLTIAVVYVGYDWYVSNESIVSVAYTGIAGALAGLFFYSLWWYSGGRWLGLGDAKLAVPLGLLVGLEGVFSLIVISFWVGASISIGLLAWQWWRRRGQPHLRFLPLPLTIKSEVPFAPFLIISFVLVFFWDVQVLHWFVYV